MFYFNTHRRIAKYKHDFADYFRSGSRTEKQLRDLVVLSMYEYAAVARCCCFDCTSEAAILTKYFQVVEPTPEEVAAHNPYIPAKATRAWKGRRDLGVMALYGIAWRSLAGIASCGVWHMQQDVPGISRLLDFECHRTPASSWQD